MTDCGIVLGKTDTNRDRKILRDIQDITKIAVRV